LTVFIFRLFNQSISFPVFLIFLFSCLGFIFFSVFMYLLRPLR